MMMNWWRENEKECWMLEVCWRWVLRNWCEEYEEEEEEEEEEEVKSCWEKSQVGDTKVSVISLVGLFVVVVPLSEGAID